MENLVIYKSETTCGYRPQSFKEWVKGTKINCNGVVCEIIDVVHNDFLGIKIAKQTISDIRKEWNKEARAARQRKAQPEYPEDIKQFARDLGIRI